MWTKGRFAEWVDGGIAEIERRFGPAVAAGKLGVVQKPRAAARLIGDSSVSGANAQCRIEERIELPTLRLSAPLRSSCLDIRRNSGVRSVWILKKPLRGSRCTQQSRG